MSDQHHFFDLQQIKAAMHTRVDDLVMELFPEAKKELACWKVGSLDGERGGSMIISTRQGNAGYFKDFADENNKGQPWKLVSLKKGMSIGESIRWLANYLNVQPIQSFDEPPRSKDPARLSAEMRQLTAAGIKYANDRGISKDTLTAYGVCSDTRGGLRFPYYDGYGQLGMTKHWGLTNLPDGKKDIYVSPDPIMTLFGKDVCDPAKVSQLVITEGEFDAMACWQVGIPAVSIPQGASNDQWINLDYHYLSLFDDIVLLFDNDEPGQKAAKAAHARLGSERTMIVKLPLKDANDMLKAGRAGEIRKLIDTTVREPIAEIVEASSMRSEVKSQMRGDHLTEGDPFFIPDYDLTFRKHEMTLWFGASNHGKALALETKIPTPFGMKTMADIHPGDWVFGANGEPVRVIAESPVFTDHECYELTFDDGTKIIADAGHRWYTDTVASKASEKRALVSTAARTKPRYNQEHKRTYGGVKTTEEIAKSLRAANRANHTIPCCKPVQGVEAFLPIHPYVLGVWLGDGSAKNHRIHLSEAKQPIAQRISDFGQPIEKFEDRWDYKLPGLHEKLKNSRLLGNKHIPEQYLRADEANRLLLLQGLLDTDGNCCPQHRTEFCSIIKELAEQVRQLACSLGIKAKLCEGDATINGRFISKKYRVIFLTTLPVFSLPYKKDRLPEKVKGNAGYRAIVACNRISTVPVKCISVDSDDHLFLCTEQYIPTHNSTAVENQIAFLAGMGKMSLVASFEQQPAATFAKILKQWAANPDLPFQESEFDSAYDYLSKLVILYRSMKKANPDHLVQTFIHAHKRYGIDTFVVDNVMTMDIDRGDNTEQADAADKLRVFVADYPVHLHVVAHPRKPKENNNAVPTLNEIRGASEWGDIPQNVIAVWRDANKGERLAEMRNAGMGEAEIMTFFNSTPCGKLVTRKQRATGDWPMTSFFFHKPTNRMTAVPLPPMPMYGKEKPWTTSTT